MKTKSLLILIMTLVLPSTHCVYSINESHAPEEYETTDSLLSETSRELIQAYDLLDMLKKRSDEFSQHTPEAEKAFTTALPKNIEQIKNDMIKKQLIDVLSVTRFSDSEKHLADCKNAISALEKYMNTLEKMTAESSKLQQELPLSFLPRAQSFKAQTTPTKTEEEKPVLPSAELTHTYDLEQTAPQSTQLAPAITALPNTATPSTHPLPAPLPVTETKPKEQKIPSPSLPTHDIFATKTPESMPKSTQPLISATENMPVPLPLPEATIPTAPLPVAAPLANNQQTTPTPPILSTPAPVVIPTPSVLSAPTPAAKTSTLTPPTSTPPMPAPLPPVTK